MKVSITNNFQLLNYFITRLKEVIPRDKYALKGMSLSDDYHDFDNNYYTIWIAPCYEVVIFLTSIDIRIRLYRTAIPICESLERSPLLSLRLYVKPKDKQIYLLKELQYDE